MAGSDQQREYVRIKNYTGGPHGHDKIDPRTTNHLEDEFYIVGVKQPVLNRDSLNDRRDAISAGDPDDKSLRKVELDVLIPKKIRERSRKEKCTEQVQAFNNCCSTSGFSMVFKCRKENSELKACLTEWFFNPEFIAECKKEYLAERSEFRRTGIGKKAADQRIK